MFAAALILGILSFFKFFYRQYTRILKYYINNKKVFLIFPLSILLLGNLAWFGFDQIFKFIPSALSLVKMETLITSSPPWVFLSHKFPGMGKEFMPYLDEGSFLYMPTTMSHASVQKNTEMLQLLNKRLKMIPEVDSVVGKIGRVESALDPAPVSMVETIITYKPEYRRDEKGARIRIWREHIGTPDDIWSEIVEHAKIPGLTSAPKLQPISTRIVMLQSGMRAPMGVKIKGPSLELIDQAGLMIEEKLKEVAGVEPATVFADRVVGKPYLEIKPNKHKLGVYGLNTKNVLDFIAIAVGGRNVTKTVEGRETYSVRVRYDREKRDSIEALEELLVPTPSGAQIPLIQLAKIDYRPGPMVIKAEDTFLTSYVLFDKKKNYGEVDVVENAAKHFAYGNRTRKAQNT